MSRALIVWILACAFAVGLGAAHEAAVAPDDLYPRDLPGSLTEQARRALVRNAWRRELRFVEAVDPGFLFRGTRIDQASIDAGEVSAGELYGAGGALFHLMFTEDLGFGGKDTPGLSRVHRGRRGGPDSFGCTSCHGLDGPGGSGDAITNAFLDGDGATQASALARNPSALLGLGFIEILAAEMSAELAATRDRLLQQATREDADVRELLSAKGASFGFLTVRADGTLGTGEVEGVDPDLVVRPFGRKGTFATIRDAVEDELLIHHGMQSTHLANSARAERVGRNRRPDPDGDGVIDEVSEGQVTALTLYLALQEIPQIEPPQERLVPVTAWAEGRRLFEQIGCGDCHRPSLPLESTTYSLPARDGEATFEVDLAREGAAPRIATPVADDEVRVYLFSDLKRHDLGDLIAEPRADRGVPGSVFLTTPLWGVARTGPYLHDGRAPTLEDAILLHGGEARESRGRFAELSEQERARIRIFLTSLTRARRMVSP